MKTKSLVPVILFLVGLGAGFFGGIKYRNYQIAKTRPTRFMGVRGTNQFGGMMGRGGVTGSILSIDANSITVKLADGSSKIVLFSTLTTYSNTVSAVQTDLKVGENVAVAGATNPDGSVTATNVQINPEFGRPQTSPTPAAK